MQQIGFIRYLSSLRSASIGRFFFELRRIWQKMPENVGSSRAKGFVEGWFGYPVRPTDQLTSSKAQVAGNCYRSSL